MTAACLYAHRNPCESSADAMLIFDELPDGAVEPLITVANIDRCVCVCVMEAFPGSKKPNTMADTSVIHANTHRRRIMGNLQFFPSVPCGEAPTGGATAEALSRLPRQEDDSVPVWSIR